MKREEAIQTIRYKRQDWKNGSLSYSDYAEWIHKFHRELMNKGFSMEEANRIVHEAETSV